MREDNGMARFIVVPQWQGSSSSRAMQLIDGAQAIAGDLPRARTTSVDVPLEAGEALDTGVRRMSSLQQVARAHRLALDHETRGASETIITIGGDTGVATTAALAAIGASRGHIDPNAAVIWFDARPRMHDPSTSESGAYESMAAGALIGLDAPLAIDSPRMDPAQLVLAGVRDVSDHEASVLSARGVRMIDVDEIASQASALADAVATRDPSAIYVQVSLDVLDPSVMTALTDPIPFGLEVAHLTAAISALRAVAPLAGASITGFAPSSPAAAVDDMGGILRIIGALA